MFSIFLEHSGHLQHFVIDEWRLEKKGLRLGCRFSNDVVRVANKRDTKVLLILSRDRFVVMTPSSVSLEVSQYTAVEAS